MSKKIRFQVHAATQSVRDLLEGGARVLGLHLCYHDLQGRLRLPVRLRQHVNAPCLLMKRDCDETCTRFCGVQVETDIVGHARGLIHTCPFGHTQIVAPVWAEGRLAGVLFAAAAFMGRGQPPRAGLVVRPGLIWMEDRRFMLLAIAGQITDILEQSAVVSPSRRDVILAFLTKSIPRPIRLQDLARHMALSASRTGHLVSEIFSQTFPQLLTSLRLERGARLLCLTEESIGAIALQTGFSDQSHFSRAFKRQFNVSPLAYRKKNRIQV